MCIRDRELEKQQIEMDYLKLQIRPHFYLNCLNFIYSMIDFKQYGNAQKMTKTTSDYLQYVFRSTSGLVPVKAETAHCEDYLKKMCIRDRIGGDPLSDANYLGVLMDQENDTTITNFFASDWYKDTTTMLYDWYQKGYISKDAGTDTENWRTVCKAGNLFSLFFAYHPGTPVEFKSSTGYDFEIVPFRDCLLYTSRCV